MYLIALTPIGIVADSFGYAVDHKRAPEQTQWLTLVGGTVLLSAVILIIARSLAKRLPKKTISTMAGLCMGQTLALLGGLIAVRLNADSASIVALSILVGQLMVTLILFTEPGMDWDKFISWSELTPEQNKELSMTYSVAVVFLIEVLITAWAGEALACII